MTLPSPAAHGLRMTPLERAMGRFMRGPDGHKDDDDGRREIDDEIDDENDNDGSNEDENDNDGADDEDNDDGSDNENDNDDEDEGGDDEDEALKAAKAELAKLKKQLKSFKGIDPKVARENAKKIQKAEKAARDAEKAKAKAEGNFEKLRELQAEEANAAIQAANEARDAAVKEAAEARAELQRAKIDTAFANSKFLQEETILSGPKAQRLFGDHVEIENGKVVVYDKPAGEAKRAKIMDSKGNPLSFNDAIQKVIEADSDKDTLLKSKTTSGAASKTQDGKTKAATSRHDRIAAGLAKLRGK